MQAVDFAPVAIEALDAGSVELGAEWLWDGYLARGNVTLFTSRWKLGKTTLLTGLLRHLSLGEPFLGRPCIGSDVLVASEESKAVWAARGRGIPVGSRASLISRPFRLRPTPDQWDEFVRRVEELRANNRIDLFVVDPLATFLPGHSDNDPGALLDFLHPLRRLADTGVAVLILHHPRKKQAEEGSTARGNGALLAFVDVVMELHRCGRLGSDANLRRLVALSRHEGTPPKLVYDWKPGTAEFTAIEDPSARRFEANWEVVHSILANRWRPATHRELMDDWPEDSERPSSSQLYAWLHRAADQGWIERKGDGNRYDPYRFGLPHPRTPPTVPVG